MIHRGQIVEKIIRKSGYSITKLANKLGVTRNTLYNRFNNPNLGYRFIVEIGTVVHHDFTMEFPEIKDEVELMGEVPLRSIDRETSELWKVETKYIALLEQYNKMLGLLTKLANQNTLQGLKKEILDFIEQEEKL
jgi:hypothetical protein